jgi:hypothetical protein
LPNNYCVKVRGGVMARHSNFKNSLVVSTRFEEEEYQKVKDIAALETITTGRLVTAQELIRDAVSFVYGDNERLRECFRRTRQKLKSRY